MPWLILMAPAAPWRTVITLAVPVLVYALLAEQQRRITMISLLRTAGPGTVIVQERGITGPALRIQVGDSPHRPQFPG